MGKIFKELGKEYGRTVEGFTVEEVVKFSDVTFLSTCRGVADYLNTLEYSSWVIDDEGDSLIVTVYREGCDEYIMAECEEDSWDVKVGYKLSGGWEPVHGFTRQYGYNGSILHGSESIGVDMVKYMLDIGGVCTWTPVAYEVEGELELEGWCLLEKEM